MYEGLERSAFWSLKIVIYVFCCPGTLWLPNMFFATKKIVEIFLETRICQTCLLGQRHVLDVLSCVRCCIY